MRFCVCVITCHNVFNVWPMATLLFPVWPRDAKRLDTPAWRSPRSSSQPSSLTALTSLLGHLLKAQGFRSKYLLTTPKFLSPAQTYQPRLKYPAASSTCPPESLRLHLNLHRTLQTHVQSNHHHGQVPTHLMHSLPHLTERQLHPATASQSWN